MKKKTRWGCLAVPIIIVLCAAAIYIHDTRLQNRPLEEKLRGIFKGSGFSIPDDVTDLTGVRGESDFQGDYAAYMAFTVQGAEIDSFLKLPASHWRSIDDFKPSDTVVSFGDIVAPEGTYMIEETGPGEIIARYGVNRELRRIYYYRASW